jgi:membrane-bound lytic murein transglycosylase D
MTKRIPATVLALTLGSLLALPLFATGDQTPAGAAAQPDLSNPASAGAQISATAASGNPSASAAPQAPAQTADGTSVSPANCPDDLPKVDIEVPDNALVQKYLATYSSEDGLKYLSSVMKRSTLYRDYIRAEIARLEVPECLFYLPVLESGFSTSAVSRSGATGIWQFMRNSVGGYGIRINDWMDERRDPWLATTAALRKLKENYNELGDWNLALAAYNCGLNATLKIRKKAGTNDYWELCDRGFFKKETKHYVPQFLAIATILSRSREYGIDWGDASANPTVATLDVKRPVDINVLAKETGIEAADLKKLNPALFYHITPPDVRYGLRIPAERQTDIETVLQDKDKMLLEFYMYRIKSGDTLSALARHYGISVDMILQYNPGVKPSTLKIGKNIVIPALKEVGTYKGKQDPDTLNFSGTYLVKKGDTLWSIALAYTIQVETLAEKNNLEVNSTLSLGKALRVPIL